MADMQKNLPCALEAEQSVLGSILIDPNCFADLTEIIHADDFYLDEHGEIFYAMQDLFAKSREIDLVTLIDTLVSRGVYNEEESKKYIKVIAETVPSAANVLDYAKIVREKSLLRSLIGAADEIRETAFSAQGDVKDIIDRSSDIFIMDFCLCRRSNDCSDYPKEKGCVFLGKGVHRIPEDFGHLASGEEAKAYIDELPSLQRIFSVYWSSGS